MEGFKFRRQQPIDTKTAISKATCMSFPLVGNLSEIALGKGEKGGCFEEGLRTSRNDSKRKECLLTNSRISNYLQRHGFKVLRFWNNDVLQNIKGVLEVIRKKCLSHPPLTPPVKGGELPHLK